MPPNSVCTPYSPRSSVRAAMVGGAAGGTEGSCPIDVFARVPRVDGARVPRVDGAHVGGCFKTGVPITNAIIVKFWNHGGI